MKFLKSTIKFIDAKYELQIIINTQSIAKNTYLKIFQTIFAKVNAKIPKYIIKNIGIKNIQPNKLQENNNQSISNNGIKSK